MKKPIAVFFTDTHLSEKTIDVNRSVYKQADELALSLSVPLLHGGDYLQSRKSQSQEVLNTLLDIFCNLKSELYGVIGNHDKTDTKISESFVDIYSHIEGVHIGNIDMSLEGVDVYGLSFYDEKTCFMSEFEKFMNTHYKDNSNKKLLILHEAVEGVKNNDGSEVLHGIPKKILEDRFDLILVGHYHDQQHLSNKIIYTGSTYQGNFGEGQNKGATIVYDDLTFEQVIFDFPLYINIKVDSISDIEGIISTFDKNDGNNYKVSGHVDFTEDAIFYRRKLKTLGISENILIKHDGKTSDSIEDYETLSNKKIVDKFKDWSLEKEIKEENRTQILESLTL